VFLRCANFTQKYPEASAFAGVAASVWNGSGSPAKVEMAVTDRLHVARGQVDITPGDFALIPFVLNKFDKAEYYQTDKKGNKKLLSQKIAKG